MKPIVGVPHCRHCDAVVFRYAGNTYATKEAAEAAQARRSKAVKS